MAADPRCDRCEAVLADWQGNVMVNSADFFTKHEINSIEVVCKSCTEEHDNLHNIWELTSVKRRFMFILKEVLTDLTSGSPPSPPHKKWSTAATDRLCALGALILPETAGPPEGM